MKERLAFICFMFILMLTVCALTIMVTPDNIAYGLNWSSFLREEDNSIDICFTGSSVVYCDIIPAVIYEETGYSSYLLSSPEQTLAFSYYFLSEMYKTQSPKVVCVELTGVFYPRYTKYTKINAGFMPWSLNRLGAIFYASEPSLRFGLLFPLYNYHDLWHSPPVMTKGNSIDMMAGYAYLYEITPIKAPSTRPLDLDLDVYNQNIDYLRKIAKLCEKNDSSLLFFISPSIYRWSDDVIEMMEKDLSYIENSKFIDFNKEYERICIDNDKDYFDIMHFNNRGARKFTRYMLDSITQFELGQSNANHELWKLRVKEFNLLLTQ